MLKHDVGGNFLKTIKSLYCDVNYCVKIDGKLTSEFSSTYGLKQGCVLSPLLFNIFIGDLPDIFDKTCEPVKLWDIETSCLQFADDLILLSESAKGLQAAITKLENYCKKWGLVINSDKTKVLIFNNTGRLIKSCKFKLDGSTIENN